MVKANLEGIIHQQDAKFGLNAIEKIFFPFMALQRKWQKSQVSTLVLFVGTVLILAAAATTSYKIIYKLLITSSQEQALLKVKQGGNEIDYWLEKSKKEVSTIADTPTAKTMNWSIVGPYFKSQVARLKEYEHLTLALTNGHYFTTKVGAAKAKMSKLPWFKLAMKGLITTSDPTMSQTVHSMRIFVMAPIKSDAGKIIGAAAGAVGINRPVHGVQSLEFGQGSYAFALNSAGEMIFGSNPNVKGAIASSVSSLFTTQNSSLSDITHQMLKGEDGIQLFRINGAWKYVAYVHLKQANWFLALVIPQQTIESPLYSLNLLATILGTLMLIAVFVTWRQIQLSQIAKAIAQQKSLLYAQTQAHVELLDQSLKERQAIEHVLRTQAKDLKNTLKELHQTQSQLLQSEKMSSLGQLVAGIAHEVNNPVNFIHGNLTHLNQYILDIMELLDLYEKHYAPPVVEIQDKAAEIELDFIRQDLPNIIDSMTVGSERIRKIVKSLRNFSHLDEAQVKQVDIHEGLDNTLMILQHRLQANSDRPAIEVIKKYGDLPLVECYAGQLNQVFMNILSNAIDAIDELKPKLSVSNTQKQPGQITIRTEVNYDYLPSNPGKFAQTNSHPQGVIRIANNGPSIDENVQKKLFDPFFTTKSIGKGTGLGMSISYSIIVEKHRGKLSCISSPGQGVEFVIEIPLNINNTPFHQQ